MNNVALACTGGGVKSAIDIGVIRGLEELGIKIEAISGASLGSCVAIMYAMGFTPEEILIAYKENMKYFTKFTIKDALFSIPNLLIRGGLKNPKSIEKGVLNILRDGIIKMSDFNMPIVIPSLDITKRKTKYKLFYNVHTRISIYEKIIFVLSKKRSRFMDRNRCREN